MKAQIVSFHCVLTNQLGKIISSTFNQDVITEPDGQADFLKGLAAGLQGLKKGEKRRICLPAAEAYGFYNPSLVMEVPRKQLTHGKKLQCGHQVESRVDGKPTMFRVIQSFGDSVTLDGNHPLAGQDLVFEIEATEAREATTEELADSRSTVAEPQLH